MYRKEAYELIAQRKDNSSELYHHGIKGQKWGVRNYQNEDGSYTEEGKKRYGMASSSNFFKNSAKVISNVRNTIVYKDDNGKRKAVNYKNMRNDYKNYRKENSRKDSYKKLEEKYDHKAVKLMKRTHSDRVSAAVDLAISTAMLATPVIIKGVQYIKAASNSKGVRYVKFEDVTNAVDKALTIIH